MIVLDDDEERIFRRYLLHDLAGEPHGQLHSFSIKAILKRFDKDKQLPLDEQLAKALTRSRKQARREAVKALGVQV